MNDLITIIGLIGSLVTIEEAGRNWIPMIKVFRENCSKKKTGDDLIPLDMQNEMVLYAVDTFESSVHEKYGNYIFGDDEITTIIESFLDEKKNLNLNLSEIKDVKECITNILNKYNNDTLSRMSSGEKVILNKVEYGNNRLRQIDRNLNQIVQKERIQRNNCWYNNEEIERQGKRPVTINHIRNFLLGYRFNCNMWGLIFHKKTVWRDITDELYDKAVSGGIYVLTGPGGEGKTTVLKQLSMLLINNNIDILYYHGYQKPVIPEDVSENTIFILDNPPDNYSFKLFITDVIEQGHTLVLGARDNEWKLLRQSLSIPESVVNTVALSKLSYKEAENFSKCICTYLYHKKSKSQILDLFMNNSYGFLYAAMLLSVSEKNTLEEIAHDLIDNLFKRSHKGLLLLSHIVFCENCGIGFPFSLYKDICNKLSISLRDANNAISKEVIKNGSRYQTRHEVISRIFYKELFSDEQILVLKEIDDILINLFEFFFLEFNNINGRNFSKIEDSILKLCRKLSITSFEAQTHVLDRIIEEKPDKYEKFFKTINKYLEAKMRLIFFRKCFEREIYIPVFLQAWCEYLLVNGEKWGDNRPYSPTWIYIQACINNTLKNDARLWKSWGDFEYKFNGAGDYDTPNSARWIYREACITRNIENDGIIWNAWAKLEMKTSGDGDYETENSAKWIYREACFNRNADQDGTVWRDWAILEKRINGAGDYDTPNSAKWIVKEACDKRNVDRSGIVWLFWANLELNGRMDENSASFDFAMQILKKACIDRDVDKDGMVWEKWALLEQKKNGPGEYQLKNSARWIFHEACINRKLGRRGTIWQSWANLELNIDNCGDYTTENSALWIYAQGMITHPLSLFKDFTFFLMKRNDVDEARRVLREMVQQTNIACVYLLFIEYYYRNIGPNDKYCVMKLLEHIQQSIEESVLYVSSLYYYHVLNNDFSRAEEMEQYANTYYERSPFTKELEQYITQLHIAFGSPQSLQLHLLKHYGDVKRIKIIIHSGKEKNSEMLSRDGFYGNRR